MAKPGEGNLFLQHVEKLVVALALVVLATMAYMYPMSPPQVSLQSGGAPADLAPEKVDDYLVARFKAIGSGKVPASQPEWPNFLAEVDALQNPDLRRYSLADLTVPQAFPKFEVGDWGSAIKLAVSDLDKIVPPASQPVAGIFTELRNTEKRTQKTVAHVTALFPADKLLTAWREAMKKSILPPNVMIVGATWQRQEMQTDGSWGQEQDITGISRPETDTEGKALVPPVFPDFTGQSPKEILDFISNYRNKGWDSYAIQPDYWDILLNSQWVLWQAHLPWTEAADRAGAAKGVTPTPAEPSRTSYPPAGPGPAGTGVPGRTGTPGPGGMAGMMPYGPGPGGYPSGGMIGRGTGSRSKGGTTRVQPPVVQAVSSGASAPITITPVPDWSWQMLNKVQVWMHDDTVVHLKRYRYRVKLSLLNPLYGHANESKSADDAKQKFIQTNWSEWSEAVKSPPQAQFFLTGASEMLGTVRFAVFTQLMGQTVKQEYNVKLGEKIGALADKTVADPDKPGSTITDKCDFSTGGTVLSIEWAVPIVQRGMPTKTTEVVVADEDGNLWIRNRVLDAGCKDYQDLLAREGKMVDLSKTVAPPKVNPKKGPGGRVGPVGPMGPGGPMGMPR